MTSLRTKFYLDKKNAKWSGVCAGIADYTGVNVLWVRVGTVLLTLMGGFPWTLIAYWLTAWLASSKPSGLYDTPEREKFWQGVRSNPRRTAGEVRSKFRDLDRRLADMELFYTSSNTRLSEQIEELR